ncbi:MAG: hypothetical protein KC503_19905 [Myxococcales bacterium]|nr:hypothetical protein [Myxococcales bacterium]
MQGTIDLLPGSVLDGRFCVSARLGLEAGRPRYAAFDLIDQIEVELLVAPGPLGQRRGYHVRPRKPVDADMADDEGAQEAPPDAARERRALTRFVDRIALTGVKLQQGDDGALVYAGWDRKLGRAVRIIVEAVEAVEVEAVEIEAGEIEAGEVEAVAKVEKVA